MPRGPTHRSKINRTLYSKRWNRASKAYLAANPMCIECHRQGIAKFAQCVDHRVPHGGNWYLFWNPTNWQALCNQCHNQKTRRESGA